MVWNRFTPALFSFATLLCASATAAATGTGSSGPGVPSFLSYQNSGIVFVYFLDSIRTGTPPGCAANLGGTYYRLAFDSTTAGGKSMLAGLVAAHEAGEGVWPYGTGDCTADSSTETLMDFTTAN